MKKKKITYQIIHQFKSNQNMTKEEIKYYGNQKLLEVILSLSKKEKEATE